MFWYNSVSLKDRSSSILTFSNRSVKLLILKNHSEVSSFYKNVFYRASCLTGQTWPERLGFNLRSSHTKDSKMVLHIPLSIIKYVAKIKWINTGNGEAPSPTPQFSKIWKGNFSGYPRLQSSTLLTLLVLMYLHNP